MKTLLKIDRFMSDSRETLGGMPKQCFNFVKVRGY